MPSPRTGLGLFGERLAAARLQAEGYTIVARNWRCKHGELDLVALQGDQVVFVEVRTRRAGAAAPEESVDGAKAARLIALAYAYLEATGADEQTPWRIDVVAIDLEPNGRVSRIEQIESAIEGS